MAVEVIRPEILLEVIADKIPLHDVLQPHQPDHPPLQHNHPENAAPLTKVIIQIAASAPHTIYPHSKQDHLAHS